MPSLHRVPAKDPGDKLDYGFDWGKRWLEDDDYVVTSTWTVDTPPSDTDGLVILTSFIDPTNKVTGVWVEKGTPKRKYTLTNQIITAGGRRKQLSLLVTITEN